MKDKTKKWLAIAGLLAVCAVLVFGISRVLYHEPDREAQAVERESEETELFVETETPEPVQAESTEAETEEPLVIERCVISAAPGSPSSRPRSRVSPTGRTYSSYRPRHPAD